MRSAPSALVLVVAAIVGCGGGGESAGGCEPAVRERLDPASLRHVLPGAVEPEYLSDPPTSGPHQPGPLPASVVGEPLARPAQVAALEGGAVLLQHRGLDPSDVEALETLAGDGVVVAPNPDLTDPVVATAWTAKQRCSGVDLAALRAFVDDHIGGGPT